MSAQGMSEATMLASLRDIHLPAEAAGGLGAEIAVTVCFACSAAVLVSGVLRVLSLRRSGEVVVTARDRMLALTSLPEAQRRVGLLHLLKELDPEGYAGFTGGLYRAEGGVATDRLEAEVAARV